MAKNWSKGRAKLALTLLGAMLLAGCAKTTGFGGIDNVCAAFEPVTWSSADTDQTISEAKAHNAVMVEVCGGAHDGR